jgi:hypothetical protein
MPCRGVTACPLLSPDYWTVQSLSGLRGHNHNAACYRMVYTLAKHASIYHLPHGACYPLITIVGLSQRTVLYTHLHHLILLLTSLILSELSYFDCVVPLSLSLSIYLYVVLIGSCLTTRALFQSHLLSFSLCSNFTSPH